MSSPIIVVTGPAGAGKSTLMRRLMSHYDKFADVPHEVSGLPMMRILSHPSSPGEVSRQLIVLGNYDAERRVRHGMAEFNRNAEMFQVIMGMAIKESAFVPVICEGGFQVASRMRTSVGMKFCRMTEVFFIDPPTHECLTGLTNRGDNRDMNSWLAHRRRVECVVREMGKLGSVITNFTDRESAFKAIVSRVDAPNPDKSWTLTHSDRR